MKSYVARPRALLLSLTLGAALAACNAPQDATNTGEMPSAATNTIEASATPPPVAKLTPSPDAAQSAPQAVSTPATISCSAEIGGEAAQALADQCRRVSPATRPPCNPANSCAMIRSEIARGCAFLDEDAEEAGCTPPRSVEAAQETIRRYYAAINAHDYATAYSQWGGEGEASGKGRDAFAHGFANTERTNVSFGDAGPVEGAAGSVYVTLPVTVDAMLADGTRQRFRGQYVLRQVNGPNGPAPSQGWHIQSATLNKVL